MAEFLRDEMIELLPQDILTGPHILDIVSSGMYNEPMMILRELIQNSTDSIDQAILNQLIKCDEAEISIKIIGKTRSIIVHDNGVGVSINKVKRTLCSIAASEKEQGEGRGFRGIGRLGALGYCDELTFYTKGKGDHKVSKVIWDAKKLKDLIQKTSNDDVSKILSNCIKIEYEDSDIIDESFFKVVLSGVKQFHNDDLMLLPSLKAYLSLNTPVPFHPEFSFKNKVESHIQSVSAYRTYKIFLNGQQIYKPYSNNFKINSKRSEQIKDVREFIFYDKSRELELARGWYGITNFESSLPKKVLMRGIAVRQGNILIGGESFLSNYFTEKRFSVWCIGEIHVSNRVKVNARRDGFEHTDDLEALSEQFGLLGGHLSKLIRETSGKRSREFNKLHLQQKIDIIGNHPVVVDAKHKQLLIKTIAASECCNQKELIDKIIMFDDLFDKAELIVTNPKEIILKVIDIINEDQINPILSTEFLTKLADSLFVREP